MADFYSQLISKNRKWAQRMIDQDPDYFLKLSSGQKPPILWIGCSDSRVPANEITDTQPGEIFVHRNIANMVVHSDMNMLSVLDYAVNILEVKHIIVCGHYGCGGVHAAMDTKRFGLVDNWIRHIKDVYRLHEKELKSIKKLPDRFDRFVELNVIEQVMDLSKISLIQEAWDEGKKLKLHGWVYSLSDGLITDLIAIDHVKKIIY